MTEKQFLKSIKQAPSSLETWLMYADWLDENGSPDGALIRDQLRFRMPHVESELHSLKTIAEAIRSDSEDNVQVHVSKSERNDDTLLVDPKKILANFPRESDGRLPLKRSVILARYGDDRRSLRRQKCLAVFSPEKRRAPQVLQVKFDNLIVRNHAHEWSDARWLWAKGARKPKALIEPGDVRFQDRKKAMPDLLKARDTGSLTQRQKAVLSVYLQDEARWTESLQLYGILIDDSMLETIHALPFHKANPSVDRKWLKEYEKAKRTWQPTSVPTFDGDYDLFFASQRFRSAWIDSEFMHQWSWRLAPWQFPATLRDEYEKRASIKRVRQDYDLRIVAFPKQTGASKQSLVFRTSKDGERFSLAVDSTASNDRFPEHYWRRDLWFELGRFSS